MLKPIQKVSATFYVYHGENKLIFRDDDEVCFVLDQFA